VHVVDELALTDPLLSRIPYVYGSEWRPGHLPRKIPEGYLDSLLTGQNLLVDDCLRRYYDPLTGRGRAPASAPPVGALSSSSIHPARPRYAAAVRTLESVANQAARRRGLQRRIQRKAERGHGADRGAGKGTPVRV
jgi:hypothetical protein